MKFPKTLYMKRESGGTGPDYLSAYEDIVDAGEIGVRIRVGVYVLKEVTEVKGVVITGPSVKTR